MSDGAAEGPDGAGAGAAPAEEAADGPEAEAIDAAEAEGNADEDTEAPEMGGGMSVSTKRATAGETVTFALRVQDESGLGGASVVLKNTETGQTRWAYPTHPLEVAEDGTLEVSLAVTDGTSSGSWAAVSVSLNDTENNSVTYYDPRFADEWTLQNYPSADLSALDFEVYGTTGDTEAPVLVGAVGVSVKVATVGDEVVVGLRTEGHDVAEASIVYRTPESGGEWAIPLSESSQEGVMTGTLAVTEDTEVGVWEPLSIEVTDSQGASRSVANSALPAAARAAGGADDVLAGDSADLSALRFEVVRPEDMPGHEDPGEPEGPQDPAGPSDPESPEDPGAPEGPGTPAGPSDAGQAGGQGPASGGIPQTGDDTAPAAPLAIGGLSAALAALGALAVGRRRAARR